MVASSKLACSIEPIQHIVLYIVYSVYTVHSVHSLQSLLLRLGGKGCVQYQVGEREEEAYLDGLFLELRGGSGLGRNLDG